MVTDFSDPATLTRLNLFEDSQTPGLILPQKLNGLKLADPYLSEARYAYHVSPEELTIFLTPKEREDNIEKAQPTKTASYIGGLQNPKLLEDLVKVQQIVDQTKPKNLVYVMTHKTPLPEFFLKATLIFYTTLAKAVANSSVSNKSLIFETFLPLAQHPSLTFNLAVKVIETVAAANVGSKGDVLLDALRQNPSLTWEERVHLTLVAG